MENKKITGIAFNWRSDKNGNKYYDSARVGNSAFPTSPIVIKIEEHQSQGEGDRWVYDIYYNDGSIKRIFNPNEVFYESIITE